MVDGVSKICCTDQTIRAHHMCGMKCSLLDLWCAFTWWSRKVFTKSKQSWRWGSWCWSTNRIRCRRTPYAVRGFYPTDFDFWSARPTTKPSFTNFVYLFHFMFVVMLSKMLFWLPLTLSGLFCRKGFLGIHKPKFVARVVMVGHPFSSGILLSNTHCVWYGRPAARRWQ